MDSTPAEAVECSTAGHQSIESADLDFEITAEDMWADGEPDGLYDGPGAFTARQLADAKRINSESARRSARRRVRDGKWIEVRVRSDAKGHSAVYAWVKREIYEEWERKRDSISEAA